MNNISSPPQSQKSGAKIVKVIRTNGYQNGISPSTQQAQRGRLFDNGTEHMTSNMNGNGNGDDYNNPFATRKVLNRTPSPSSRRFVVDYSTSVQPERLMNDEENEAPTNDNYPETDTYYNNSNNNCNGNTNEPTTTTTTTTGYNQDNAINDEWETHKKRGASALQNVNISINTADYQAQQMQQQQQQQQQQQSPPIKQTATPSTLSSNVSSTTDLSTAGSISPSALPPPPPAELLDNASKELNSSSSTSLSSGNTDTSSDINQPNHQQHHQQHHQQLQQQQQVDENSYNVNNPDLTNVSSAANTQSNADSMSQASEATTMSVDMDPFRTPRKADECQTKPKQLNNFITSREEALVDLAGSGQQVNHQQQAEAVIFDSIFSNDTGIFYVLFSSSSFFVVYLFFILFQFEKN